MAQLQQQQWQQEADEDAPHQHGGRHTHTLSVSNSQGVFLEAPHEQVTAFHAQVAANVANVLSEVLAASEALEEAVVREVTAVPDELDGLDLDIDMDKLLTFSRAFTDHTEAFLRHWFLECFVRPPPAPQPEPASASSSHGASGGIGSGSGSSSS